MPRPKQSGSSGQLSAGQAAYVLDRLISERRISQGEVNRFMSEMGREISDLEAKLARLRAAHGGGMGGGSTSGSSTSGSGAGQARRGPGRPPGRAAGTGSGRPGRPPGRRGPGRPPGSGASAQTAGASSAGAASGAGTASRGGGAKRGRRRSAITPEQLASRQLQGRYLALVRQFPATRRAQFAKTAKEKGREAAIREMQDARK